MVQSVFFFSSRRRHTRCSRDWSSDVCSSDLAVGDDRRAPGAVVREAKRDRSARHAGDDLDAMDLRLALGDRKSTRLNSSHGYISYAVFCLKKKKLNTNHART